MKSPLLLILSLFVAGNACAQTSQVPLYTDLGTHTMPIPTTSRQAQQYFDQGLRLTFGFNHPEAIRAFTRATQLDPSCAMCWWGLAYAHGPHVNAGMDSAGGVQAYAAIQKARAASGRATARERAYIRALGARYAAVPPADRAKLDSAYATAMAQVALTHPTDLDAATLHAESLMDLRPRNYWMADGAPYPGTTNIVRQLERVIASNPQHPGACHYYIHAVEAVKPELALPCAERLAKLMPGAGHMVHMPAHIYIRVGRWNDAVTANEHAIHTDETFIEGQKPEGPYPMSYYPHNIHFLAFVSTMAGRSAQAIEAAKNLAAKVNPDAARQYDALQEFVVYHPLTLATFGKWDEVLAAPLAPRDMPFAVAMGNYARGVAFAAKGQLPQAQAALDSLNALAAATPETGYWKNTLTVATHSLMGEIAHRKGDHSGAITHLREAVKAEDASLYFEPPLWYHPVRHSLGAVLLAAGQNAEAEKVYRESLKKFPENGWALYGLAAALKAQGKTADAVEVEKRFATAWSGADVKLTASRF